ncbi:MAG: hypothetical protein KA383_16625 [Phycisphaerae bacterium]|nr:hypothetical protein [Phycisphaerae bacterium]
MSRARPTSSPALSAYMLAAAGLLAHPPCVVADEPAFTVLADFEDASVAAQIAEARNVLASDCRVGRVAIPARGQGSLTLEIGATTHAVSVACDLTFREPTRFSQADRVSTYCWINEGENGIAFRVRDARGQLFESPVQIVKLPHRWVPVSADLKPDKLQRVRGTEPLAYPLQIQGYRVTTDRLGKQSVFFDELLVEHRVRPQELIQGGFEFDEPTRIYEPGSDIRAAVLLENRSRQTALNLTVDLAWMRPDGTVLQTQRAELNLPASGVDFRSRRKLDFSQRIREPGLYRLVAQARASAWSTPNAVETSIAVTPSNRRVSRGRSTFFGVRTNLLREPELDQLLEISVARDIGVNLLALDAPWRLIEPKAGAFDFTLLDPIIPIVSRDMATLLVITEPPEWLPPDPAARVQPLNALITALAGHFGERLVRFRLEAAAVGQATLAAQLEAVAALRARLAETHPKIDVLPPPIRVAADAPDFDLAAFARANPHLPLGFETTGDSTTSLRALEAFRAQTGLEWHPSYWWSHLSEPLIGPGHFSDAEDVLRHYVRAARAGVATLTWFDLRDDDNESAEPATRRGLIRRDFSPRTPLLGFASAAGILTGHRCSGPLPGTPDAFESALFIGVKRQVAVLLPHPNRLLPIALVPVSTSPGDFTVQDFERRSRTVVTSSAPPLVPTIPRPLFLTLALKQAETEPALTLAPPWFRVPATVFYGTNTSFELELDAPRNLQGSYVQLRLPKPSPLAASASAVAMRGAAGDTIRQVITLTPQPGEPPRPVELTLRLSLEGETIDLPLAARPLTNLLPAGDRKLTEPTFRVAALTPAAQQRATASVSVHGAYTPAAIELALLIEDDRLVPFSADAHARESGDQLLIGITRVGSDALTQVRVAPADTAPQPQALHTTSAGQLAGWRCTVDAPATGPRILSFTIPASTFGAGPFAPGDLLLLAIRYADDDADGFPAAMLSWGGGLDGSHSTLDYQWLRAAPAAAP